MDKFPIDFNRKICNEKMTNRQNYLIKQIREEFFNQINKGVDECEQHISLNFPDKLSHEHKITLITELLERFGKVKLTTVNSQCSVIKLINTVTDIPQGIKKVTIEFINGE